MYFTALEHPHLRLDCDIVHQHSVINNTSECSGTTCCHSCICPLHLCNPFPGANAPSWNRALVLAGCKIGQHSGDSVLYNRPIIIQISLHNPLCMTCRELQEKYGAASFSSRSGSHRESIESVAMPATEQLPHLAAHHLSAGTCSYVSKVLLLCTYL